MAHLLHAQCVSETLAVGVTLALSGWRLGEKPQGTLTVTQVPHLLLCNILRDADSVHMRLKSAGRLWGGGCAAGHSLLPCFTLDKLTRGIGIGLISNMNVQGGFLDLSYLMQSSGGFRWPGAEHEEESWTLWGLRVT